jgi:hypothetical protein
MIPYNASMYLEKFNEYTWIKNAPSHEELELFEKTKKYMKYISWIPGLRMVAVCNSLSMYASDADSDIDLFVVTEKKRIWLVRILMTLIFQILGIRRHGKKVAKRFCLSFFSTVEWLDFNNFRLENDIYLAYWIYYLKPILDTGNTYEILREANKSWTSEFFAEEEHAVDEKKYFICHNNPKQWTNNWKILDWIDAFLKKLFLPKTLAHKKSLWNPIGIIVNENMLKFHNNDRREEIKKSLI